MGEMGKRNTSQHLGSLTQHTSLSGCIQNLKTPAIIAGEESVIGFYEKERKMDK